MKFYVDSEALKRPVMCSHMSKTNEFDKGVLCVVADPEEVKKQDDQFALCMLIAVAFGALWAIGILTLTGRLQWLRTIPSF